ncbi:MAG: tripartite tricarboxylate transporter substrate binding protein [Deltaproteobacteria bacterium]|nr:tripartite tricarboxylate transporter substrate binding protein [Deltaproteobacteria bacterium]
MKRMGAVIAVLLTVGIIFNAGLAKADNYPTKSIKVVVPYSAGGGTDTIARAIGKFVELNKPFVVTNITGGGAKIGTMEVAGSKPDGYTLLMHSVTAVASGYHAGLYDTKIWKDLKPVASMTSMVGCIAVKADSPYKTIGDLIAFAKANPGKVSAGVSGIGGGAHIIVAVFADVAGVKLNYVPFAGASNTRAALMGGHVDMAAAFISEVYDFVKSGNLRVLATTGSARSSDLPDVPTFQESGIDFVLHHRNGIFAPKGTSDDVIKVLDDALQLVADNKEFQNVLKGMLIDSAYLSSDDFTVELEKLDKMIEPIAPLIRAKK